MWYQLLTHSAVDTYVRQLQTSGTAGRQQEPPMAGRDYTKGRAASHCAGNVDNPLLGDGRSDQIAAVCQHNSEIFKKPVASYGGCFVEKSCVDIKVCNWRCMHDNNNDARCVYVH